MLGNVLTSRALLTDGKLANRHLFCDIITSKANEVKVSKGYVWLDYITERRLG